MPLASCSAQVDFSLAGPAMIFRIFGGCRTRASCSHSALNETTSITNTGQPFRDCQPLGWPRNSRKSSSVLWLKSQFADQLASVIYKIFIASGLAGISRDLEAWSGHGSRSRHKYPKTLFVRGPGCGRATRRPERSISRWGNASVPEKPQTSPDAKACRICVRAIRLIY